jgi:hypothetical protein
VLSEEIKHHAGGRKRSEGSSRSQGGQPDMDALGKVTGTQEELQQTLTPGDFPRLKRAR